MGGNCSCQKDQTKEENDNQIVSYDKKYNRYNGSRTNDFHLGLDAPVLQSEQKIPSTNSQVYSSMVRSERRLQIADSQISAIKDKAVISTNDNATYEGEMKDGLPDGKGKEVYKNGEEYVGQFLRGKKHGFGIYYKPGQYRYSGNFLNNKRNGYGVVNYENGAVYKGNFKNGVFDGKGTFVDEKNVEKTGQWKDEEFLG